MVKSQNKQTTQSITEQPTKKIIPFPSIQDTQTGIEYFKQLNKKFDYDTIVKTLGIKPDKWQNPNYENFKSYFEFLVNDDTMDKPSESKLKQLLQGLMVKRIDDKRTVQGEALYNWTKPPKKGGYNSDEIS